VNNAVVEKIKAGDTRTVAKLITRVEQRDPGAIDIIKKIYPQTGRAHLIGITGAPGTGKSTLVAVLAREFRKRNKTVAVLAVDPSSPFSGGALLGDRARMSDLFGDKDVFIRSLATRGALGGLSAAVNDVTDILDVSGKDIILIETVGVGQVEIDIARLAQTVLLVLTPGYGDSLQAMKSGIMEIADIFVVNKADMPGADRAVNDLKGLQSMKGSKTIEHQWIPPIVKTDSLTATGVEQLTDELFKHFQFLQDHNFLCEKRSERRIEAFMDILIQIIRQEFLEEMKTDTTIKKWMEKISSLDLDPYTASEQVIDMIRQAHRKRISER
jgi:LAO/AO transport system kinase